MANLIKKILKKNYKYIFYNFRYDFNAKIRKKFRRRLEYFLNLFGYKIVPENELIDYYLHEYKSYKEYKNVQIYHNKRKINKVFADKKTLGRVAEILLKEFSNKEQIKGICHGSRNGFEQNYLRSYSNFIEAIGTDISDTAKDFDNSVQWDFHDVNEEWIGLNNFVYSNSLDQSWQPKQALKTWLDQLKENGLLILEHTSSHGPSSACKIDPFGVRPKVMPYVLTMWFGSQISIEHSLDKKDTGRRLDAWLFVIRKNVKDIALLD